MSASNQLIIIMRSNIEYKNDPILARKFYDQLKANQLFVCENTNEYSRLLQFTKLLDQKSLTTTPKKLLYNDEEKNDDGSS